jgi:hypothetical protein
VAPVPGTQGLETDEKNVPVKGENGPYGLADERGHYRPGPVAADKLSWEETIEGFSKAFVWAWRDVVLKPLKKGPYYYMDYTSDE